MPSLAISVSSAAVGINRIFVSLGFFPIISKNCFFISFVNPLDVRNKHFFMPSSFKFLFVEIYISNFQQNQSKPKPRLKYAEHILIVIDKSLVPHFGKLAGEGAAVGAEIIRKLDTSKGYLEISAFVKLRLQ